MQETSEPLGTIHLSTLGGGAALEKFQEEFGKLVANCMDPNTEAKAKRSVKLEVTVVPNHDRVTCAIAISAQAKLAPVVSFATTAFLARDHRTGRTYAFEQNPRQLTLQQHIEANQQNVTPLQTQPQQGASK